MDAFKNKIDNLVKEYDCKDFDGYNIFRVLKITKNEVKTQSRIIADLLNPKSKYHSQSKEFMELFLKNVLHNDAFTINKYKVSTEYDIKKHALESAADTKNYGRIDILLEEDGSKAIVIENKVYAKDQHLQLERYLEFCVRKYGDSKNFRIIYLTQFGEEYATIDENLRSKIVTISYDNQIRNWLTECRDICNDMNQKLILNQLLNSIDYLTNLERRRIRNRLIQFEIYKNKKEAETHKVYLNDEISLHKRLYDESEKDLKALIEQHNNSGDFTTTLKDLTSDQLYKILKIKKRLSFYDMVKAEDCV